MPFSMTSRSHEAESTISSYRRSGTKKCRESTKRHWHHFTLLMWKNFLLRKRHIILTIVELILPCLLTVILAKMRADRAEYQVHDTKDITYPTISEDLVVGMTNLPKPQYANLPLLVGYAPNTRFTREIMEMVEREMKVWKDIDNSFKWQLEKTEELQHKTISTSPVENGTWYMKALDKMEDLVAFGMNMTLNDHNFVGNVFFDNVPSDESTPKHLNYTLRFNPPNWNTNHKFTNFRIASDALWCQGALMYIQRDFTTLQLLIDRSFIKMVSHSTVPDYKVKFQLLPLPKDKARPPQDFHIFFAIFLPNFLVFGFIFICPSVINGVVQEKETGMTELLKMVGVPQWLNLVGWICNVLMTISVSIILVVFLLVFDFSGTGAVLDSINPGVVWFLLALYTTSCTAFCFTISAFFNSSSTATGVGMALWIISYLAPALTLLPKYPTLSYLVKMLTCLSPHAALTEGLVVFAIYEENWQRLTFGKLTTPGKLLTPLGEMDDNFTVADVYIMLTVDTVIYLALAVYVSNVMPGGYGVTKPWYFIFRPCDCRKRIRKTIPDPGPEEELLPSATPSFEAEPEGLPAGIVVSGMQKTFSLFGGRTVMAVSDATLTAFQGQITVLLGDTGAGKSTLLNMLVGLYSPDKGRAHVGGVNIKRHLAKAQRLVGFCPQHNMLIEGLTVKEHFVFFGMLKDMKKADASRQAEDLAEKLNFREKLNAVASTLSGGQKRKLCLGISLLGEPQVLILDEPTSGMDPEARRAVWDLLLELRGQYTTLITTQIMEEADILGDRIAIMVHGSIKCCGSPHFLKKAYEMGYHLKLTMSSSGDEDQVTRLVQSQFPGVKREPSSSNKELGYRLPVNQSSRFLQLFEVMDRERSKLGIASFGVSLTTMDDVFMKVVEEDTEEPQTLEEGNVVSLRKRKSVAQSEKLRGVLLGFQRLRALMIKSFLNMFRRWPMYIGQAFIMVLLTVSCIVLSNHSVEMYTQPEPPPYRVFSLEDYSDTSTMVHLDPQGWPNGTGIVQVYQSFIPGDSIFTQVDTNQNLTQSLLDQARKDQMAYKAAFVVAADFKSGHEVVAMFSAFAFHGAPLSLNLVHNAMLRHYTGGKDSEYSITTANYPLPMVVGHQGFLPISSGASKLLNISVMFSIFMTIGLSLLATGFLITPTQEKISSAKQLQLMTGTSPVTYWMVMLFWDTLFVLLTHVLVVLVIYFMDDIGTYVHFEGLGSIFYLLLTFSWCSLAFSYLVSFFSKSVSGALGLVSLLHVVSGTVLCYVVFTLEEDKNDALVANILRWIFQLFPAYLVSYGLLRFSQIATKNNKCKYYTEKFLNSTCDQDFSQSPRSIAFANSIYSCCENFCRLNRHACHEVIKYLDWEVLQGKLTVEGSGGGEQTCGKEQTKTPSDRQLPAPGQCIVYMFLLGTAYMLLVLLLEGSRTLKMLLKDRGTTVDMGESELEEEVRLERQLVAKKSLHRKSSEPEEAEEKHALLVQDVAKTFGSLVAVQGLSFRVDLCECFGLLGVNGAGKTTTFRMLTGDMRPTRGNAVVQGYSLKGQTSEYLRSIGYCPQYDGLVDTLTGKEMLQLFASLRGVPWSLVKGEAEKWLAYLGLEDSCDQQCGQYSSGTKRKLSTAMALVGDPPLVLLDEPTSGMDPRARRRLWKALANIQMLGQAVVLTSHSMEECEVLCQRVAIMVNGQFQCLGSPQQLKNKFGQGFTVLVKLRPTMLVELPHALKDEEVLETEILTKLAPCVLKDKNQGFLHYHVTDPKIPWSTLFRQLEGIKERWPLVEDYSVGETTLEQIFLVFAKGQRTDARDLGKNKILKNIFCSQCCRRKKEKPTDEVA